MATEFDWEKMTEPRKIEVVSLWIRESTPPTGIAILCNTTVGQIDNFVAVKLPTLKNMYEGSRLTQERMEQLDGDDYPPFKFKQRYG